MQEGSPARCYNNTYPWALEWGERFSSSELFQTYCKGVRSATYHRCMDPTKEFPLKWPRTRCTFDASLEQCSKSQVGISGIQKCPKHEGFFSASSESPQWYGSYPVVRCCSHFSICFFAILWPDFFLLGWQTIEVARVSNFSLRVLGPTLQESPWLWLDVGDEIPNPFIQRDSHFKATRILCRCLCSVKVGQDWMLKTNLSLDLCQNDRAPKYRQHGQFNWCIRHRKVFWDTRI